MGDDYSRLIAGTQSRPGLGFGPVDAQIYEADAKYENLVWSRVMSMHHFTISGVFANKLFDDLKEAEEEIADANKVGLVPGKKSAQPWELLFNPKASRLDYQNLVRPEYHIFRPYS